jgi:hypothetical protein
MESSPKAIKPGAGRKSMHPLIEQQVHQESMNSRREGICVTLASIAERMRTEVLAQLPLSLFKASSGWIKGYKKRHPCKLRVPTVMIPASKWKETVDQDISAKMREKIESFFAYKIRLKEKHSYTPARIINMDETPVYFNNPSMQTVHYGSTKDPFMEGNHRARVTVMLTCTADGKLLKPAVHKAGGRRWD